VQVAYKNAAAFAFHSI